MAWRISLLGVLPKCVALRIDGGVHSDGLLPLLIAIALLRNLKNKKENVFGSSLKKYTYNNAVNKSGKLDRHSLHCIGKVSHLKIRWPRTYHSPRPWLRALVAWARRDQRLSKRSSGSTAGGLCLPKFLFAAYCARWNIFRVIWRKKGNIMGEDLRSGRRKSLA